MVVHFFPPLQADLRTQEGLVGLSISVMSQAVKCPLTVPGTLTWLRQGVMRTVSRTPMAWQKQQKNESRDN